MSRIVNKENVLFELKKNKLIERYYYWTEIERRRFDDVMAILSHDEFFISEQRIMVIIREKNEFLNKLIASKPNAKQLKLFEL